MGEERARGSRRTVAIRSGALTWASVASEKWPLTTGYSASATISSGQVTRISRAAGAMRSRAVKPHSSSVSWRLGLTEPSGRQASSAVVILVPALLGMCRKERVKGFPLTGGTITTAWTDRPGRPALGPRCDGAQSAGLGSAGIRVTWPATGEGGTGLPRAIAPQGGDPRRVSGRTHAYRYLPPTPPLGDWSVGEIARPVPPGPSTAVSPCVPRAPTGSAGRGPDLVAPGRLPDRAAPTRQRGRRWPRLPGRRVAEPLARRVAGPAEKRSGLFKTAQPPQPTQALAPWCW